MKRNYLLTTLAAAGMLLLASAPSFAACPAGTVGTPLAAGQWAIKIQGFVTDNGICSAGGATTCPDPVPFARACFGVITSDGACDITGGDVICDKVPAPGITSPTTTLGFPDFSGVQSPGNDVGSYFFNSNNTGQIAIVDITGGQTYAFGIEAELGNTEMRGASLYPGATSDPLVITIEKRNQVITAAQFLVQDAVTFDPAGGASGGNGLGKGFDAVGVATTEHLDPETATTPEGGGTIFFNVDGGYDSDIAPGIMLIPSTLICDFHSTVLSQHTSDGTQLSSASLNADYACPLSGAAFQTATVLWGATNGNAFLATTGAAGVAASGIAVGTVGRAIAPGTAAGMGVIIVTSAGSPHPVKTATITNGSVEPLDWTNITVNGVPDVTVVKSQNAQCTGAGVPAACCTGLGAGACTAANCTAFNTPFIGCTGAGTANTPGTCPLAGDLAAWNPVASVPKPTCTINLENSGTTCTTGAPETGTYELVAADGKAILGTPTATGVTFSLKCQ